jgi:hypothetical protein
MMHVMRSAQYLTSNKFPKFGLKLLLNLGVKIELRYRHVKQCKTPWDTGTRYKMIIRREQSQKQSSLLGHFFNILVSVFMQFCRVPLPPYRWKNYTEC